MHEADVTRTACRSTSRAPVLPSRRGQVKMARRSWINSCGCIASKSWTLFSSQSMLLALLQTSANLLDQKQWVQMLSWPCTTLSWSLCRQNG